MHANEMLIVTKMLPALESRLGRYRQGLKDRYSMSAVGLIEAAADLSRIHGNIEAYLSVSSGPIVDRYANLLTEAKSLAERAQEFAVDAAERSARNERLLSPFDSEDSF